MKQLPLNNAAFIDAERGFKDWLDILGYAAITVYNMPNAIREFLHWLEGRKYTMLTSINGEMIADYYEYLKRRPNARGTGGLSNAYLNKHQQAIKKFAEYLWRTLGIRFSLAELCTQDVSRSTVDVITVQEVHQMLVSTECLQGTGKSTVSPALFEALKYRDRAMIAVFYGCGIRRNEAVQLDVSDIKFHKRLLHVRSGKNYTERIIPISGQNLQYMKTYLKEGRPVLLKDKKHEAFFISARGKRVDGQTMLIRLKELIQRTGNEGLREKHITLHTLRHTIATQHSGASLP